MQSDINGCDPGSTGIQCMSVSFTWILDGNKEAALGWRESREGGGGCCGLTLVTHSNSHLHAVQRKHVEDKQC